MKVVIIGTGKVASFFAETFYRAGIHIDCIIGRSESKAAGLAGKVESIAYTGWRDELEPDIILVAVSDRAIRDVVADIPDASFTICHTAGAVNMDALAAYSNRGVIYPLQSIAGDMKPDEVPILTESNNVQAKVAISMLTKHAGFETMEADSDQRLLYHLAAVFANNFSNAVLGAAAELLSQYKLDSSVLEPIIRTTFERALSNTAASSQTGPAVRGDEETMQKHLELLKAHPDLRDLYAGISAYLRKKGSTEN